MFKTMAAALLVSLAATTAFGAGKISGLICDDNSGPQEIKIALELKKTGKGMLLTLRNARSLTGSFAMMTSESDVEAILRGDLAKMDKKVIVDKQRKAKLEFRVDGYTFDRKPRLGIVVTADGQVSRLSSCSPKIDRPITVW